MKLNFESSSRSAIELYDRPYRLYFVEGLGDVQAEGQSQKAPYQDGSQYIDSILESRHITIELRIVASSERELSALKRNISSTFNPKLGLGTFQHVAGDEVREIQAVSESIPHFPDGRTNRGRWFQKALINLTAPDPYWRSLNQESEPLQAYVGNFKLPMTFPFMLGTAGSRTTLYNDGDTATPIEIEIHGPTTNPQVFNRSTGESLRINRTIAEGETLYIDTTPGQKRVEILSGGVYTQAFGYLDHDSTLFGLEIGENEIEHVADAGNRHAQVIVRWQSRYVGV